MAEDKDFEERGYKRYPPSDIDCDAVKYFYQKKIRWYSCSKILHNS